MVDLLAQHDLLIHNAVFSNGEYSSREEIYCNREKEVPKGIRGPTGPTGCTGCWAPSNYQVKRKSYKAYCISARPKHDTQESYENLVKPFLNEYDDLGVAINFVNPQHERIRGNILPGRLVEYNEMNCDNEEVEKVNKCIDYLFQQLSEGHDIDIGEVIKSQHFRQNNKDLLYSKYYKMKTDLEEYKQYKTSGGSDESYCKGECCCCQDDCDCRPPYASRYYTYQRSVSYDWYAYSTVTHYKDSYKLYIKCHEHTKLYSEIQRFLSSK